MPPEKIKRLREEAQASQAVFAAVLNTSVSTVQKWGVGNKCPSGPSLKLLNLIEQRGVGGRALRVSLFCRFLDTHIGFQVRLRRSGRKDSIPVIGIDARTVSSHHHFVLVLKQIHMLTSRYPRKMLSVNCSADMTRFSNFWTPFGSCNS